MADQDKIETRYNYMWIHNVFGHFVKDTMDYFAEYLYPRFSPWKVIGTFDKAVEYINKNRLMGRDADQPQRPGLILDPSGEFNFDDTYGKLPYRYPNLAPGWVKYVYEPIYQDEQVLITVAFGRLVGEFNFLALMSSFYEYTDMKVFINLIFGGTERPIFPRWFNSFIILPPEIYNYEYYNDVTGMHYHLNLDKAYHQLVRTTNTDEVVYPCRIKPRYKLTNMTDSSARLGGVDNLPDWKLAFTLSYEVEIPTYLVLESDYLAKSVQVNINYGSCYSSNEVYLQNSVPTTITSFTSNVELNIDSTSNTETIIYPDQATIKEIAPRLFKTRYYHILTKEEADSTTVIEITLPEQIIDHQLLSLVSKAGPLTYWDHYKITNNGWEITIDKTHVTLEEKDILEIYVYEYMKDEM